MNNTGNKRQKKQHRTVIEQTDDCSQNKSVIFTEEGISEVKIIVKKKHEK